MIRVVFEYDEASKKWEARVTGTAYGVEAVDAFHAVVLTCRQLNPELFPHTQIRGEVNGPVFHITPAARPGDPADRASKIP